MPSFSRASALLLFLGCTATTTESIRTADSKSNTLSGKTKLPGLVALEEHVGFAGEWHDFIVDTPPVEWHQNLKKLLDVDQGRAADRVKAMDAGNIDYMILSMTGDTQSMTDPKTAVAKIKWWNERMKNGANSIPKRLGWFCVLPMFDVDAALAQMKDCHANGALGAMLNGYSNTGLNETFNYYDTASYNEFWSTAESLGFIIYLHPRSAEPREFFTKFPEMQVSPWGFSMETAEHALRFILSGFFDKYPKLQFILGHNGEMLPYWAWRIDHRLASQGWEPNMLPTLTVASGENGYHKRAHNVTTYLKRNFHVTTSGMFETSGFHHMLSVMGEDRVMFSIDTPYESVDQASGWYESVMGTLDQATVEKLSRGNAINLFGLKL